MTGCRWRGWRGSMGLWIRGGLGDGCCFACVGGGLEQELAAEAAPAKVLLQNNAAWRRSEEHTSELPSLMRTSYAVFCLKKKINPIMHCFQSATSVDSSCHSHKPMSN